MDRHCDKLMRVETAGPLDHGALGLDRRHGNEYVASPWHYLRSILPVHEVSSDDVFIDFGSGKGRVLIVATEYPFRRVIGVDLHQHLNAVARSNLDKNRYAKRASSYEIIDANVLDYEIPDDVTVVYMFNPFVGSIFQHVIDGLVSSLKSRPRQLRIIYYRPVMHSYLIEAGFVVVRKQMGVSKARVPELAQITGLEMGDGEVADLVLYRARGAAECDV